MTEEEKKAEEEAAKKAELKSEEERIKAEKKAEKEAAKKAKELKDSLFTELAINKPRVIEIEVDGKKYAVAVGGDVKYNAKPPKLPSTVKVANKKEIEIIKKKFGKNIDHLIK